MSASVRATMLSALRPVARGLTASSARILMYHRFSSTPRHRRLSADVFERQIRYLKDHYEIVSLRTLVQMLLNGPPPSRAYVAITVDDGYADFAEFAYPILKKHAVPATVYLVSGFVDQSLWLWFDAIHHVADVARSGRYEVALPERTLRVELGSAESRQTLWEQAADAGVRLEPSARNAFIESFARQLQVEVPALPTSEYRAMTWESVRSMDAELIEWGGHTFSHPILSTCSPEEQFNEIDRGRRRIEEMLQRPVQSFCYPNGQPADYDRRTIAAVKRAGFTHAVVAHGGMVAPGCDPYLIERLGAPEDETDFRKCVDGLWEVRRIAEAKVSRILGRRAPGSTAPHRSEHDG